MRLTVPTAFSALAALCRPLGLMSVLAVTACSSTPPASTTVAQAAPAPAPVASPMPAIKVGIALGGGAAKGFAHIGVIKMLEANGFAPAVVAGTSAGSVVGALYASGMNAFELQEKAIALDEAKIRDLQLSSAGLLLGQKLEDYVNEQVRRQPLERLAKPFVAVATRLEDGDRTVFALGNTGQAVRASSSVPGVFQPVAIGKYHFVDGGVVSPVPVDAARQLGADVVVAVDISSKARGQTPAGMLGTLGQSIAIMGQKLGQAELARADVIVRPQVLDIGGADFTQRANAILEGEKAALAAMPQIRERIAQLQASREQATRLAQQKAAEAQRQACLEQRSRLQKLAGLAGLDGACPAQ
ncbi:patatin-like phospholipase family protein [Ramlibacter tataouinensis]|uniref:Patatin n=1 Tax=Ramlibacter tataouinensis TaxID=94132 RepID=A0A127JRK7_9BURK|nr:patatin-like phospholipase family protein [Ramlibacter tataouinensis]AMO22664.1 Patatin [Ramlibacter tataouinensis]